MTRNNNPDWRIEDVQRDLAPALATFAKRSRYAVLRGREVVECRDAREWAERLAGSEYIVEQTTVNRYWVSTVFLGLNSQCLPEGPPLWFETMVFEELEDGRRESDRFCRRYTTWTEAEAGHAAMVEIIRYGHF